MVADGAGGGDAVGFADDADAVAGAEAGADPPEVAAGVGLGAVLGDGLIADGVGLGVGVGLALALGDVTASEADCDDDGGALGPPSAPVPSTKSTMTTTRAAAMSAAIVRVRSDPMWLDLLSASRDCGRWHLTSPTSGPATAGKDRSSW
jgi:hypothetical protein